MSQTQLLIYCSKDNWIFKLIEFSNKLVVIVMFWCFYASFSAGRAILKKDNNYTHNQFKKRWYKKDTFSILSINSRSMVKVPTISIWYLPLLWAHYRAVFHAVRSVSHPVTPVYSHVTLIRFCDLNHKLFTSPLDANRRQMTPAINRESVTAKCHHIFPAEYC